MSNELERSRQFDEDVRRQLGDKPKSIGVDPAKQDRTIIEFNYKNHAGKYRLRRVIPEQLEFTKTQWHPERQWILHCYDMDKRAQRSFALKDCDFLFVTEGSIMTEHIKKNLKTPNQSKENLDKMIRTTPMGHTLIGKKND